MKHRMSALLASAPMLMALCCWGGDGEEALGAAARTDVVPGIQPSVLPGGTVGVAYSQELTATCPGLKTCGGETKPGGKGSIGLAAGELPPGMEIGRDALHTLRGTPTTAGAFTFTLAADCAGAASPTQEYTLIVSDS